MKTIAVGFVALLVAWVVKKYLGVGGRLSNDYPV
jgi:hypothetical protein